MKKETKVNVYETSSEWDLPTKAGDFMAFWDEKLALIPEKLALIPDKFRGSAQIEIEAMPTYDDQALLAVTVSYTRVETDAEEGRRERNNQMRKDTKEQRERSELVRLKKKYDV